MDGLTDLEAFSVEVADHVATVTMRRHPVNAQNRRFREEIVRVFDTLHDLPEVRTVVLTARALSAPLRACGSRTERVSIATCTLPDSSSVMAGPVPR